jgi:ribose 5-phosphate isomerase B
VREAQVRSMVRRVVYRTLGKSQPSPDSQTRNPVVKQATDSQPNRLGSKSVTESRIRTLVSEADVAAVERDGVLEIQAGALVTPLAREAALERNVELRNPAMKNAGESSGIHRPSAPASQNIVAIGADHGGYDLKESLKRSLAEWGYEIVDCGTASTESVDYPDYAFAVAQMVANGSAWLGVMIDGAGIGSCMAANKIPGVRASMCYDQATAVNSREHNNANLLTLGAGLIGSGLAKSILKTWLETPFAGGRHAKRVDKIGDIERRYLRSAVPA